MDNIIENQRIALDKLLDAVERWMKSGIISRFSAGKNLREVYREVSSASTMTGTDESSEIKIEE